MSAPPYMRLYIGDYLADTHHLSRDEHGAYLLLLMALWRAGGKLPNTPDKLARLAHATPEEWERLAPVVLPFFTRKGGSLTQKRASKEIDKYQRTVDGSERAGKASAAQRANKNKQQAPTNVDETFNANPTNQNHNQNQKDIGGGDSASALAVEWPEPEPGKRIGDQLAEAVDSPWVSLQKSAGLVTSAGRIVAWRRDGADWPTVVAVVSTLAAKAKAPIANWTYFDRAIAQAIADSRRTLDIPDATAVVPFHPQSITDRITAERAESHRLLAEMVAKDEAERIRANG